MLVMPAAAASAGRPAMLVEVSTRKVAWTLVRVVVLVLLLLLVAPEHGEDSELLAAVGDTLPLRLPLRLLLGDMETEAAGLGRWVVGRPTDAVGALPAWVVGGGVLSEFDTDWFMKQWLACGQWRDRCLGRSRCNCLETMTRSFAGLQHHRSSWHALSYRLCNA